MVPQPRTAGQRKAILLRGIHGTIPLSAQPQQEGQPGWPTRGVRQRIASPGSRREAERDRTTPAIHGTQRKRQRLPQTRSLARAPPRAACHTTQFTYKGTSLRIDGGPTLADFNEFIANLNTALQLTFTEADRFDRFATKVLGGKANAADKDALRTQLETQLLALRAYADRNRPPFAHGFGRLDAFGLIMNEVFGTALKIPANYRATDAPVSYPDLWYTPETSWVQWNGSASSPFLRNVGEVTGTFGHVQVTGMGQKGFPSTVRGKHLHELEQLVAKLQGAAGTRLHWANWTSNESREERRLYTERGAPTATGKSPTPERPPTHTKTPSVPSK